jgi:hypothetical protein
MRSARLAAVALAALLLPAAGARSLPLPGAPSCPIFPASNPWNRPVDTLPVATNSAAIIASIGAGTGLHPDFGSGLWDGGPIGIPITVVSGQATPKYQPEFDYADESDLGPYPIPPNVAIEGGNGSTGDRHAIIVDRDACKLYELYSLYPNGSGWTAGSGAVWNLSTNVMRPEGWTSADAAGLPILPGLARYDEVARGAIDHALRFTVQRTRRAYVYPARHYASSLTDPSLPPMGLRVRLKASFDTRSFPPQARIVLDALKRYGMMVADNGSNWYISGAPDPGWDNDDLSQLSRVKGSDFEVVDTSSLGAGPTSAAVTALSARRTGHRVVIRWTTAADLDVLGYAVYRLAGRQRTSVSGLIFRTAASSGGAYRFVDRGVRARSGVRYLVELIHPDGRRAWFGPVRAG